MPLRVALGRDGDQWLPSLPVLEAQRHAMVVEVPAGRQEVAAYRDCELKDL